MITQYYICSLGCNLDANYNTAIKVTLTTQIRFDFSNKGSMSDHSKGLIVDRRFCSNSGISFQDCN